MSTEDILSKLISFPVLGGESNLSIIHWIRDYIESYNVPCTLVPNASGTKASLHCRIGPATDGGLVLSGHTDVVPVAGQDWETDPFTLTDKNNGKLYGRGSCDMKGFLACCLSLLPKMAKVKFKKPIYFAFSYDEEIGCLSAPELIEHLLDFYPETPKYAIIGEPSLCEPVIGHKGICLYKTTVNGSAGHSSGILREVSAVHECARLVLWLEDKMKSLLSEKCLDDRFDPPHTTIHVGTIKGGIAANVIADKAEFTWDVRVIPNDRLEDIMNDFYKHCKSRETELQKIFPDFQIKTEELHPPVLSFITEKETDIVKLMSQVNPRKDFKTVAYASEAGQFNHGGFQSIICGPGSIQQAHRANEFIAKEELKNFNDILENLMDLLSSEN